MSSFFRNLTSALNVRESIVKENLISTLNENAKEIQFECKEQATDYMELNDCTNSLCTTLEAFFLHGLKDSFLWQTMNQIVAGDIDHRPSPSFWSPILIFMHKQTIEQIQNLSQLTSEIGYCRAWIRISLNESLFSSYLNNIRKNNSALNSYYKKYAILKDNDTIEIAAKILEGIETAVQINLPINSTLLNQWPDMPLQMSALWTPPLRSCPISTGVDVASSLTADIQIPKPLQSNELFTDSISNSPFAQSMLSPAYTDLTHSEHLQILLNKIDEDTIINNPEEVQSATIVESSKPIISDMIKDNSVAFKDSWSAGFDDNDDKIESSSNRNSEIDPIQQSATAIEQIDILQRSDSMTQSISSLKSPIDHHSYNTLLVRHRKTRELDWNDVWERFENSLGRAGNDSGVNMSSTADSIVEIESNDMENVENFDFEILSQTLSEKFTTSELHQFVENACKLSHEHGLDAQGFVCRLCSHPLGIGFAPAQVCSFTGYYYCDGCISSEQFLIPARIIYNWDFRKYSVSKIAADFMTEFQCQPFIDFKLLNPDIYGACDEMAELQSLRIRLNFIRAYLFTCCQSIIDELQKHVWSREYLYEHIHCYSIGDLTMIQRGTMVQLLRKTVIFGENHILNCSLCSLKGFICEICNSSKVLYPFHIDTTFRCSMCGAVFHDKCLNDSQPCPKCERRRKREDLPLFEAVNNS